MIQRGEVSLEGYSEQLCNYLESNQDNQFAGHKCAQPMRGAILGLCKLKLLYKVEQQQ